MISVMTAEERIKALERKLLDGIIGNVPIPSDERRYFNPSYHLCLFNEESFDPKEDLFKKTVFFINVQCLGEDELIKCFHAMCVVSDPLLSDTLLQLLKHSDKLSYSHFDYVFRCYGHIDIFKASEEGINAVMRRDWMEPHRHCIRNLFRLLQIRSSSFSLDEKITLMKELPLMIRDRLVKKSVRFKIARLYCNLADEICSASSIDRLFSSVILEFLTKKKSVSAYFCLRLLLPTKYFYTLSFWYVSYLMFNEYSQCDIDLRELDNLFSLKNLRKLKNANFKEVVLLGLFMMLKCDYDQHITQNTRSCFDMIDRLQYFADMKQVFVNFNLHSNIWTEYFNGRFFTIIPDY